MARPAAKPALPVVEFLPADTAPAPAAPAEAKTAAAAPEAPPAPVASDGNGPEPTAGPGVGRGAQALDRVRPDGAGGDAGRR